MNPGDPLARLVTIDESFKEGNLPVSDLPLVGALRYSDSPPKFGTIVNEHLEISSEDLDQITVKVLVSHHWGGKHEPNSGSDWKDLQVLLTHLIRTTLQVGFRLLQEGFPLGEAVSFFRWFIADKNDPVGGTSIFEFSVQNHRCSPGLGMHMLLLACEVLLETWTPAKNFDECLDHFDPLIARRILLWYDWICLPQWPDRTAEELRRFRRTLDALQELQRSMHTICLTSKTYERRAWCVAESLNMGEHKKFVLGEADPIPSRVIQMIEAVRYLWNPLLSSRDVLVKQLGLSFTNDEHTKYEDVICWILWNSLIRIEDEHFFGLVWRVAVKENGELEGHKIRTQVGLGNCDAIIAWLELIIERLDSGKTSCSRLEWQATREAAGERSDNQKIGDISELIEISVTVAPRANERGHYSAAFSEAVKRLNSYRNFKSNFAVYLELDWCERN